jgi:predicted ATPase
MIHLRQIILDPKLHKVTDYPGNVPVLENFTNIDFKSAVTILVGENGSGKSTVLEAVAKAVGSVTIGSEEVAWDKTLTAVKPLANSLQLVWNKRTHRGFFLRAEDFFGYIKKQREEKNSIRSDIDAIGRDFIERSDYAKSLAIGPSVASLNAYQTRYGRDLDANSHGESFLKLFQARFVPGGLYLLDEPEAALSPMSQLGLITMIKQMVEEDAQFIIATHSPILMAINDAVIFDFDHSPPTEVTYDSLESVTLFREFLLDPDAYLRHL